MVNLHSKISPDEVIVGWYATGRDVKESSGLIHNFFWREMNQAPVHLLLGTDLAAGKIQMSTYHAIPINLSDRGTLQQHFLPLPNEYLVQDQDRITFDVLTQSKTGQPTLISDLNNLEYNLKRLLDMIETVSQFVDNVISGKEQPNTEVGRFLQQTLTLLPTTENAFDQMFTNGVQDVLMVVYLSNLTRSHLLLAEKLRDQTTAQQV
jgi:translation initiation factor 3 subunit F